MTGSADPLAGSLRIAMVCPYSLSRPGGVQGQATGLARALRRRGHRVTVLAPTDSRSASMFDLGAGDEGSIDGVRTSGVGRALGIRSNGSVAPVALSPLAPWRVERFVAHHGVDVVHLHEPLAPTVGYGALLAHRTPVVATFHRSGGSGWYRALGPAARRLRRRIDVACAVSEAACRTAREALGGDCDVLFNGVDTDEYANAPPRPTRGRPTALFLGRHEDRKGLAVMLDAFDRMGGRAQLWIAGSGPRTAALRLRHPPSERLMWLGTLSESEKASAVAGADVLVAPSLGGESFGMVLLEGMAGRCAVVASDIDGYRDAAAGHAELVAPGDPGALARVVSQALDDAALGRGRSSPAALDAAAAHAAAWSLDALAAAYEDRYRSVLAGRAGPGR